MVGKSLLSRVILLVVAIILLILLWNYGVSLDVLVGAGLLIVIRVIFLLVKLKESKESDEKQSNNLKTSKNTDSSETSQLQVMIKTICILLIPIILFIVVNDINEINNTPQEEVNLYNKIHGTNYTIREYYYRDNFLNKITGKYNEHDEIDAELSYYAENHEDNDELLEKERIEKNKMIDESVRKHIYENEAKKAGLNLKEQAWDEAVNYINWFAVENNVDLKPGIYTEDRVVKNEALNYTCCVAVTSSEGTYGQWYITVEMNNDWDWEVLSVE